MRHIHEEVPIHDDAPSPEQLFDLAKRSVVLAKEHRRFRTYDRAKNPRSHFMMPRRNIVTPDLFEAPFGFRYEKLLSARISKAERNWSMHLIMSHFVVEMGDERGAERHTYSFRWNQRSTTMARHLLRIMPAADLEIADHIDAFAALDELSGDWSWRTQMEQVSAGEIDHLMKDIKEFDWATDGTSTLNANFTAA